MQTKNRMKISLCNSVSLVTFGIGNRFIYCLKGEVQPSWIKSKFRKFRFKYLQSLVFMCLNCPNVFNYNRNIFLQFVWLFVKFRIPSKKDDWAIFVFLQHFESVRLKNAISTWISVDSSVSNLESTPRAQEFSNPS